MREMEKIKFCCGDCVLLFKIYSYWTFLCSIILRTAYLWKNLSILTQSPPHFYTKLDWDHSDQVRNGQIKKRYTKKGELTRGGRHCIPVWTIEGGTASKNVIKNELWNHMIITKLSVFAVCVPMAHWLIKTCLLACTDIAMIWKKQSQLELSALTTILLSWMGWRILGRCSWNWPMFGEERDLTRAMVTASLCPVKMSMNRLQTRKINWIKQIYNWKQER